MSIAWRSVERPVKRRTCEKIRQPAQEVDDEDELPRERQMHPPLEVGIAQPVEIASIDEKEARKITELGLIPPMVESRRA